MQTRIIDGKAIAHERREALRSRVAALTAAGRQPGLAAIMVGDDSASRIYVRNKIRTCAEIGIRSEHIELPAGASEAELLERIRALNADRGTHGIVVQLPLPPQISAARVIETIAPQKDVDGFHAENVGRLATGELRFAPCTPAGIMAMLAHERIDPAGKHAVIVGRSNIVGKPMALLLLRRDATVTICHSKTADLAAMTRQADILVVTAGRPNLIRGDMMKTGAVVIDVGINRLADGTLVGDVDFQSALGVASRITPVPGGVGPMTIAMLLENTVIAAERNR